jgi:CRISPR/Cas system CSM-associated protein Csm2 small subunit
MQRHQAERLGQRLTHLRPDLAIEVYRDGQRRSEWLVSAFDPMTRTLEVFERDRDAFHALEASPAKTYA